MPRRASAKRLPTRTPLDRPWRELPGTVQLRAALVNARRGRKAELAARLGVSDQCLYFWKVGQRRPGPEFRAALLACLGIPLDAWCTPGELLLAKERARRLRGRAA